MLLTKHKQLVYFVLSGGVAAVVNVLSRIVLNIWMPFSVAIVAAYLIGMVTAFVLNRVFVFPGASNPLHHQVMWFTLINLAAVVQTLVVSLVLAHKFFPAIGMSWHPDLVAHAVGVATPILTSYIGHKRLSFRAT
jgi:putative flippase GtrA